MEENNKPVVNNVEEKKGQKSANPLLICLVIFSLLLGGTGFYFGYTAYTKVLTPITFLGSGTDGNSANFVEGSIADIADKVSESVVSIVTSIKTRDFFGQSYDSSAAGTGIIVSEDGYVLTNKHVIEDASTVYVVLDDGTTYEKVEIVATDPLNDVAFLKIKGASAQKHLLSSKMM